MKFNFGTGLVIAMGLFMIFILQYVIRVQIDSRFDNEWVTENYYQQEIEVDGKRDREINAVKLENTLEISLVEEGVVVEFPGNVKHENITGKIFLYRPSDQKQDFEFPISLSSSNLLIPKSNLADGRWDIQVEWSYDGVAYRNVENLVIK